MTADHNEDVPSSRELYEKRRLVDIATRWDVKAPDWDQNLRDPSCHLNEDAAYERFLEQASGVIESRRPFCANQGVIDAGCATGLVLAHVVESFTWGIGVDISPQMIQIAKAKALTKASFQVGDCFELSSICPNAGAVFSRGVLLSHYGCAQGLELLRSFRRALVPGGFVLCDFLNLLGAARYKHAPENKTYYKPTELCSLAKEAGFSGAQALGEPERRVRLLLAEF